MKALWRIIRNIRLILCMSLLFCFGGSPSSQPLPAPAPTQGSGGVQAAEAADVRRRRAAASNTVLTSPLGVTNTPKASPKSLLGGN